MKKNKQIIIEVFNENYLKHKFKLPYRKDLLVGVSDVRVDIKVGEKILQDILPNEFEIDLPLNEPLKISIKPHDGNFFAGWGRWFNWEKEEDNACMLRAILSDPDWAQLESETKIGDNFRMSQYHTCKFIAWHTE